MSNKSTENKSNNNKNSTQMNDKNEKGWYDKGVKPIIEGTKNTVAGAAEYTAGKLKGEENWVAKGQHDIERGVKHFKNIGSSQEVKDDRTVTEKMDEQYKGQGWYDKGVRPVVEGTRNTIEGTAEYITGKTNDQENKQIKGKHEIERGKKHFKNIGSSQEVKDDRTVTEKMDEEHKGKNWYDKGVRPIIEGTRKTVEGAAEYITGKTNDQENKQAEGQHEIDEGVKHFKNIGSSQEVKDERTVTEKMDEKHKGKDWYDKGVRPVVEGTRKTVEGTAKYTNGKMKDKENKEAEGKHEIDEGIKHFKNVGSSQEVKDERTVTEKMDEEHKGENWYDKGIRPIIEGTRKTVEGATEYITGKTNDQENKQAEGKHEIDEGIKHFKNIGSSKEVKDERTVTEKMDEKHKGKDWYDKGVRPVVEGTKKTVEGTAKYTNGKMKDKENKEAEGKHEIDEGIKHFKNVGSSKEVKDERTVTEKMDEEHKGNYWYDNGVRPIIEGTKNIVRGATEYITGKANDDDKKVEKAQHDIDEGKKEYNKVGGNKSTD